MGNIHGHREARVGDLRQAKVTVPEAAQILELGVDQVRKAIDRNVVTPIYILRGRRRIRALDGVDVLCLRMRNSLTSSIREQLYIQLKRAPERESLKKFFHISVARKEGRSATTMPVWVYDTAIETLADIASVKDLARLVDEEGKIRDSDVEAHRIAALVAGGMSVDEVLHDYPNLSWPSPAMATAPPWRTHRMVVPCQPIGSAEEKMFCMTALHGAATALQRGRGGRHAPGADSAGQYDNARGEARLAREQRSLAAILVAGVRDFSRRMGRDENGTHSRLKARGRHAP